MQFPIAYSVPEEIIVPYVPLKTCHTAKHDYQFTDSGSYLKNYGTAIFGETRLKCGWDCFRHYEILSQGTIPYFHNLQECPKKTLFNFPKVQVLELMEKYGSRTFDDIMKESSSILYNDLDDLLRYTKDNLTTRKSAEYILSKTQTPFTTKVLFLHNINPIGDYLCDMVAHGFSRLTDGEVDIYPNLDYLYDSYPLEKTSSLYGKGFNYTRHLPSKYKKDLTLEAIWEKCITGQYDQIVVYFQHNDLYKLPFFSEENDLRFFYPSDAISFLCGRDCDPYWSPEKEWYIRMNHNCDLKRYEGQFNAFIREYGDD